MTASYDARFFSAMSHRSLASAQAVVPILVGLLKPASVLDVGCGGGEWLSVFRAQGVSDVAGLDMYAAHSARLLVPAECVATVNLGEGFDLQRRFDLVVCLEVAEHLPESASHHLVAALARHSDLVVFSAALPGQGGTDHVNEQWLEYWVYLFDQHGFGGFDVLRPLIWERADVAPHYRQNMVLFVSRAAASVTRLLHDHAGSLPSQVRSVVHPDTFRYLVAMTDASRGLRYALGALQTALLHRLGFAPRRPHACPEYPPVLPAAKRNQE